MKKIMMILLIAVFMFGCSTFDRVNALMKASASFSTDIQKLTKDISASIDKIGIDAMKSMEEYESIYSGVNVYIVKPGDNLWDISSKDIVYGDPFLWTLIYRSNWDIIDDQNLIEPNMELQIRRDVRVMEVFKAKEEANKFGE